MHRPKNPITRAAIYMRGRQSRLHEADLLAKCETEGHTLVALTRDDTAGFRFHDLNAMAVRGEIDVILTTSPHDLPSGRIPRIEFLRTHPYSQDGTRPGG